VIDVEEMLTNLDNSLIKCVCEKNEKWKWKM